MAQVEVNDTTLLALGGRAAELETQLQAFEADPRDLDDIPEVAAVHDEHATIMGRLAATPAHTIAGLHVKAQRVLAYGNLADPLNELDADAAIALSIARDVLQLQA